MKGESAAVLRRRRARSCHIERQIRSPGAGSGSEVGSQESGAHGRTVARSKAVARGGSSRRSRVPPAVLIPAVLVVWESRSRWQTRWYPSVVVMVTSSPVLVAPLKTVCEGERTT